MKKILVPIDFSEPSIEAFQFAVNLAKKNEGKVTVLHAVDLPIMAYGASVDMPVYTFDPELLKDLQASATNKFNKMLKKHATGFKHVKFAIVQGAVFPVIRDYINRKKFDLVVMGTHGASGFKEFFVGSNAEKVVRFSQVPVLTIRKSVPLSSVRNIVFPTSLQTGQSGFVKKLKELQKFFKATVHILYLNTPFNFIRDNELKQFVVKHKFSNCTINVRNDRYEPDGIISFAKEIKADLLAMPTNARKGLSHLIYGSVTEDVVNHVECPVWTFSLNR